MRTQRTVMGSVIEGIMILESRDEVWSAVRVSWDAVRSLLPQ